jgi:hypothetical protein
MAKATKKTEVPVHEIHEDVVENEEDFFDVTTDEGEIQIDENGIKYRGERKDADGCTIVYR